MFAQLNNNYPDVPDKLQIAIPAVDEYLFNGFYYAFTVTKSTENICASAYHSS